MTPILARYEGFQEWPGHSSFELWTILQEIPGHPIGSTLSLNTLREEWYQPFESHEAD